MRSVLMSAATVFGLLWVQPVKANGIDSPSVEMIGYDDASGKLIVSVTTTFYTAAPYANNPNAWADWQNVSNSGAIQTGDMAGTALGGGAYTCTAFILCDPGCTYRFRCCGSGQNTGPQDTTTEVSGWVYLYVG